MDCMNDKEFSTDSTSEDSVEGNTDLVITLLVDNTAGGQGMQAEHGLSFWIERGDVRILFDTGQGMVLQHNAKMLGIPLASVDSIVLSHGHYDHTGGLADVLNIANSPKVYAHPNAFQPKYSRKKDSVRYIGIGEAHKQAVMRQAEFCSVTVPREIAKGIWCTGPIPRLNRFETFEGQFFKDLACETADFIEDDQALYMECEQGIIVVLGCAHAGVVNTLQYIRMLTNDQPVLAVLGGMHLGGATTERLEYTVKKLHSMNIEEIMPCHCTGFQGMAYLSQSFKASCKPLQTGAVERFI